LGNHPLEGHDLLFREARGGPLSESVYGPVRQTAREWHPRQLNVDQRSSPALTTHATAVSLSHRTPASPAPEVARRAGHGVEVLLSVYAGCIDGQDQQWKERITDVLTDGDARRHP
jgi:hypothetical protein